MRDFRIGRFATFFICCCIWTTTNAQQFGGSLFLSIRDCTGIDPNDSCIYPFVPTEFNPADVGGSETQITDSGAALISSPGLGSAEGRMLFDGQLNTPTLRNEVITEALSRNAATVLGTQSFTYVSSAPGPVPFGGAFTYSATGTVDSSCGRSKDISDFLNLPPGTIFTSYGIDQCSSITVWLQVSNASTGQFLAGDSLASSNGVIPSPSLLEATTNLIPGETYEVSAFFQTVARGAGQSISSLNSLVVGLVDPATGMVVKDVPASLPQLAEALIPASDPNQPSAIEIDILPGSSKNPVRIGRNGVIPVALLTTEDFFAPDVDRDSLSFGPGAAGVALPGGGPEDVDGDGDIDFIVHFSVQESGIACGDTDVFVSGKTMSGDIIVGGDTVTPVRCD